MIRASDLTSLAPWTLATPVHAPRVAVRDGATWFDAGAPAPDTAICGDLGPASRGLSVEQHAQRVLAHLRDDGDRRA